MGQAPTTKKTFSIILRQYENGFCNDFAFFKKSFNLNNFILNKTFETVSGLKLIKIPDKKNNSNL